MLVLPGKVRQHYPTSRTKKKPRLKPSRIFQFTNSVWIQQIGSVFLPGKADKLAIDDEVPSLMGGRKEVISDFGARSL